jgi:GNAT superfamily N-acetyltransferase
MNNDEITISAATTDEIEQLDNALTDFNPQVAQELPRAVIERLDYVAKDPQGNLVGGIQAMCVNWGILEIDLLFVYERYRKSGFGAKLLRHVEELATQKGCYLSVLSTFDFQAKDFYLKHGYKVFGVLDACPKSHCRYYLSKKLL